MSSEHGSAEKIKHFCYCIWYIKKLHVFIYGTFTSLNSALLDLPRFDQGSM